MKEALKLALEALVVAEAGLADIGDADRDPTDDLAWCEKRAAQALAIPRQAITALREALARPEHPEQMARLGWQYVECPACGSEGARAFPKPEEQPVAWVCYGALYKHDIDFDEDVVNAIPVGSLLYASPPQRQPLTDAEIWQMVNDCSFNRDLHADKFARAIEAAHGITGEKK